MILVVFQESPIAFAKTNRNSACSSFTLRSTTSVGKFDMNASATTVSSNWPALAKISYLAAFNCPDRFKDSTSTCAVAYLGDWTFAWVRIRSVTPATT
jgi:hypothetical protein